MPADDCLIKALIFTSYKIYPPGSVVTWNFVSLHHVYRFFQVVLLFLNTYLDSSWMSAFCLRQTSEGLCTSWLGGQSPTVSWAPRRSAQLLCTISIRRCWICLLCELLCKTLLRDSQFFSGKNSLSCCWLLNADYYIIILTETPMNHSYGTLWSPVSSPSVPSPCLCLMLFWSNNLSQCMALLWSNIIVIACINTHLVPQ